MSAPAQLPAPACTKEAPPTMKPQRSNLAVVPAYNEQATVARVIDSMHEHAPEFDVLVVDDGSHRQHRRRRQRGGRERGAPPVQPRDRRSGPVWLHLRPRERLRPCGPGGRRRPALPRPDLEAPGRDAAGPSPRHGLRLALLDQGAWLPRADQPPDRDPHLRVHAVADRRPARQRPHLRVPALQSARDSAVRAATIHTTIPRSRLSCWSTTTGCAWPRFRSGCCSETVACRRSDPGSPSTT